MMKTCNEAVTLTRCLNKSIARDAFGNRKTRENIRVKDKQKNGRTNGR